MPKKYGASSEVKVLKDNKKYHIEVARSAVGMKLSSENVKKEEEICTSFFFTSQSNCHSAL
jgi:hypothetical protein